MYEHLKSRIMEKLRILIVDDEKGIQTGIRRVLRNFTVSFPFHDEDFEFDLIDADTGEDAIEIIEEQHIDIVLLDNKLPGIEGVEVLEYIKEKEYDLAVIMITSYASIDLAVKATNNGAFNFVPKPFNQNELRTAVESITKHLFLKRMTKNLTDEAKEIRFKFLSVLSHELKSPINAVEGYLRIMEDKQLGDDFDAYATMIERSIKRIEGMRTLIMDMLDFTRVESGKKVRHIEEIDFVEIAQISVDSVSPSAIQKNVNIITDFPEKITHSFDEGELEIIFNNLLSNAVKYNKDDGRVEFSLRQDDQNVYINVKDTGIGMSEEEKANLFKEFMRAKNEKTREISGTGLGLSILKKIVDLNKGIISVKTEINKGSEFSVKLPVNVN
jgi:two-component system sensor histidine kinase/response regulator